MLYIGSAQPPTPVLQSLLVPGLASSDTSSLVIAKPDRIELWDVGPTGLVHRAELEVWGSIVGIEKIITSDARPHIAVLLGPTNAALLLVAYDARSASLAVADSTELQPPTPSLRQAEFFRSVITQGSSLLVSLWVGVLSCIEVEVEKDKDLKRRRSSAVAPPVDISPDKRLRIRENYNINIREQNLLSLAFHPGAASATGPVVSFLSLTPQNNLHLQMRSLSSSSHAFTDLAKPMDVGAPGMADVTYDENTDFGAVPFSCPAARRALPIPTTGRQKLTLVIGDEFTVLYSFGPVSTSPRRPSISPSNSQRASAVNRSPQTEFKQLGKRRKSSSASEAGEKWELRPMWRIRQGFGTVLAATPLVSTDSGGLVLMSDDSGRLKGIAWESSPDTDGSNVVRVNKIDMGSASPALSLTHLSGDVLFLASACGDSQLLRLDMPTSVSPSSPISPSSSPRSPTNRKGKNRTTGQEELSSGSIRVGETSRGSSIVLERWMNLAPVNDFCVVEDETGGASHLVVASGTSNASSLRSIRSGAGLEQRLQIEGITGVERMWPIVSEGQSSLLISTAQSTALLHMSPDVAEAKLTDVIASQPTIAAAYLPFTAALMHVSPSGVSLWNDVTSGTSKATWQAPGEVTAASIAGALAAVAVRGGSIHLIEASQTGLSSTLSVNIGDKEVSAVAVYASSDVQSPIIAVGTWSNEVLLYRVDRSSLARVGADRVEAFVASSLLLVKASPSHETTSGLQLLAGLSDGSLVTYDLDPGADDLVTGRKASSLGTQPLILHPITGSSNTGEETLLAIGLSDRTSILFESRNRVEFSSVNLQNVSAAVSLSLPDIGPCIAMSTPTGLSVAKVNGLKKMHIGTLDLGHRNASIVNYLPQFKVVACGVTERRIDEHSGDFWQHSHIELRDPTSLQVLESALLEAREEVTCIAEIMLRGQSYLAVGTAIHPPEDDIDDHYGNAAQHAKEGRLLLIAPTTDRSANHWTLDIESQCKTVGGVAAITTINGFLAIAAGSTVSINRYDGTEIKQLSTFASTFLASALYTLPPTKTKSEESLVVGDGLRSILVLDVDEESGQFYSDDRDMATHQVRSMTGIRDQGPAMVIADGYSNILTFRMQDRIVPAATFGLHEDVVRFQQGSFAPPASAPETIKPDLVFATVDGRLGMIGELTNPAAKLLDDLQRNMAKTMKGPGSIPWRQYRRAGTPLVQRATAGFIDGDFVQKFLDADTFDPASADKVLNGSNVHERVTTLAGQPATRAEVMGVLEATAGLH